MVHPQAAGIDIGSQFHVVAVSEDLDAEPVRTFSTFTNDLHRLAEWLTGLGIVTVAMESTGVYWIPAFEILQARGVEVVLVNARDAKTVPFVDWEAVVAEGKPLHLDPEGAAAQLEVSQARMLAEVPERDFLGRSAEAIAPHSLPF